MTCWLILIWNLLLPKSTHIWRCLLNCKLKGKCEANWKKGICLVIRSKVAYFVLVCEILLVQWLSLDWHGRPVEFKDWVSHKSPGLYPHIKTHSSCKYTSIISTERSHSLFGPEWLMRTPRDQGIKAAGVSPPKVSFCTNPIIYSYFSRSEWNKKLSELIVMS